MQSMEASRGGGWSACSDAQAGRRFVSIDRAAGVLQQAPAGLRIAAGRGQVTGAVGHLLDDGVPVSRRVIGEPATAVAPARAARAVTRARTAVARARTPVARIAVAMMARMPAPTSA